MAANERLRSRQSRKLAGATVVAVALSRVGLPQGDDRARVRIGERTQQQDVHDGEDGRARAQPQAQDHHRRGRERGITPHEANALTEVVDQVGIGGQLPAQPRRIGQAAEDAMEEAHLGSPVQLAPRFETGPAMAHFRFPFLAPARTLPIGNDTGHGPQDMEAEAQDERLARAAHGVRLPVAHRAQPSERAGLSRRGGAGARAARRR